MARVHVCFVSFRFPFYACCCTLPELTVADSFSLDTRSHSGGTKRHWLQRHAGDVGPVYKWTEESEKYKQGKPSCIMMLEAHSGQCQRYPFVDFARASVHKRKKLLFSLPLSCKFKTTTTAKLRFLCCLSRHISDGQTQHIRICLQSQKTTTVLCLSLAQTIAIVNNSILA